MSRDSLDETEQAGAKVLLFKILNRKISERIIISVV